LKNSENIQTSNDNSKENEANANFGTSNIFAMLNIGLAGTKKKREGHEEVVNEQKTHTTVSLFQKLVDYLKQNDLIRYENDEISIGDFMQIEGSLSENPIIEVLNSFQSMVSLSEVFNMEKTTKKDSKKPNNHSPMIKQITSLTNALQADGQKDIICTTDKFAVVLPTDNNYFLNKSMNELTDGRFKVLGKVISICGTDSSISLLRNTPFSRIKSFELIESAIKSESISQIMDVSDIATKINGPALMIIPIAIFI